MTFGLVNALPFVKACLDRAMVNNCIFAQVQDHFNIISTNVQTPKVQFHFYNAFLPSWRNLLFTPLTLRFLQATVLTIALYSCLGHKEFRFLLPVVPLGCCFVAEVFAR